jgi:hypothetical protein
VEAEAGLLQPREQPFILPMGADPEPNDRVTFTNAHGAVAECHASGENWLCRVHLSEPETGMTRVLLEELIGVSSLLPDLRREGGEHGEKPRRGF